MRKATSIAIGLVLVVFALGIAVTLSARGDANATRNQASGATDPQPATSGKQLWHCGMHPQIVQDHPGQCPICHMALTPISSSSTTAKTAPTGSAGRKILYWWDPMIGPSSISNHPGKSAMGMDLVPVYAEPAGPQVVIDPAVVQNMGVRTAPVRRGPLHVTIRAVGLLKIPEPGIHDVSLKVGGWIDKLYADQNGMHVMQGEPLFDLYSPQLQVAEQELIAAMRAAKAQAAAGGATDGEAKSLVRSARRKLQLWGVAEQDIDAIARSDQPPKDIPFRSPATGHVEDKTIVQGSGVAPMTMLMRIADHTQVWLDAQVYQNQVGQVKLGQKMVATVNGMPGKPWEGTISFIDPHLDPATRTLKVRMTLASPDFELKPGMYASARILTEPVSDAILVPREAVIDTGTRQIAFVVEGNGHFAPRRVQMGWVGDRDEVQILQGLSPGETVVTSGQFLMDVESRTIEATEKFGAPISSPITPATRPVAPTSQSPSAAHATTQPATQSLESKQELSVAYCPMAKASWLQRGEAIANPYMGQAMSTCGIVQKKLLVPPDSPLAPLIRPYLDVQKALNADKLDPKLLAAVKSAADKLPADMEPQLRNAAAKLANVKDLSVAREAFHALSDQLIAALEKENGKSPASTKSGVSR
jgi:RND family efflux transporter MFP subunit